MIKVGLNVELTGDLSAVGKSSKDGAMLAVKQINDRGGVKIDDRTYLLDLDILDNQGDVSTTEAVTQKLIDNKDVAIIGPNASKFAIAAGNVAEKNKILLISPWSTNPKTTENKKYVYRAAFIDPFQGQALANFASKDLKAVNAAILYD